MQVDRAGGPATVSISVLPGVYSSNLRRVCQGYAILSLSDSKSFCATSWTEVCGWVADILRVSTVPRAMRGARGQSDALHVPRYYIFEYIDSDLCRLVRQAMWQ